MTPEQLEGVRKRSHCLYTQAQVEAALEAMALAITAELAQSEPVLLSVMNGALIFAGKLATQLDFPLQMDYVHATRYRESTSGEDLQWRSWPAISVQGRVVLVLDDILDEGLTLAMIVQWCKQQGANKVYTAVLIEKLHQHKLNDFKADFVGLQAEDYYLYGYGMDYRGYFRNAPGIFAVAAEDL
jgi:hypoxanthine phosphoribosyltransferase